MASSKVMTGILVLAWIVALGSLVALWNLGWLGTPSFEMGILYDTPGPELFAGLLGLCLLGSVYLIGHGAWRLWAGQRTSAAANLFSGVIVACLAGLFVLDVLANEDAEIPVVGPNTKPANPVKSLRLFNLNVLHGYPAFERQHARFRETDDILQQFRTDLIVLQEVCNSTEHGYLMDDLGRGRNHTFARANGSRRRIGFEEGSAVLSRLPILESKRIVLRPRDPFWENRIALVAKLHLGGNETLTLVGVHLSDSASAGAQAEFLMTALRDDAPDIIVGDLNAEPSSRAVNAIINAGYLEAIPTEAIHGREHYKLPHELVSGPIIDHLFLSASFLKDWKIERTSWVLTSKPVTVDAVLVRDAVSDHDAILIDLVRR